MVEKRVDKVYTVGVCKRHDCYQCPPPRQLQGRNTSKLSGVSRDRRQLSGRLGKTMQGLLQVGIIDSPHSDDSTEIFCKFERHHSESTWPVP